MVTALVLAVGAIVGGIARLLLPGERDISARATVLAGLFGISTVGVVAAELTGIGIAGGSVSIIAGVVGTAMIVLLAERFNRRRRARHERVPTTVLLTRGECTHVEFKSTARYNLRTESKDPAIELAIARSVAGLANTHGGSLLIGVDDTGQPIGLHNDLRLVRGHDHDAFELWLHDLLGHCLGRNIARHVRVTFEHVPAAHSRDVAVCRVDITAADEPIYLRPHTGDRTPRFPVRIGNSTRVLDVNDTVNYVINHWPHLHGRGEPSRLGSRPRGQREPNTHRNRTNPHTRSQQ